MIIKIVILKIIKITNNVFNLNCSKSIDVVQRAVVVFHISKIINLIVNKNIIWKDKKEFYLLNCSKISLYLS